MLTLYTVSYNSQIEFANKTQFYTFLPNKSWAKVLSASSQSLKEINDWKNWIHDPWKKMREDVGWGYSSDCYDSSEPFNCFLQVPSQIWLTTSDSTNMNNWILLLESVKFSQRNALVKLAQVATKVAIPRLAANPAAHYCFESTTTFFFPYSHNLLPSALASFHELIQFN